MVKILYVSLDGILKPLGRSQVLGYLVQLAKEGVEITLISHESINDLRDISKVNDAKNLLRSLSVTWVPLRYFNRPRWIAQLAQLVRMLFVASFWCVRNQVDILHSRSFLPAICGSLVALLFNRYHVFDIRGFWVEERADVGNWRRDSFLFHCLFQLEKLCWKRANAIVTLTHASVPRIRFESGLSPERIVVIPTCCDLDLFGLNRKISSSGSKQLIYVGTTGLWYDFDLVVKVWKRWRHLHPDWTLRIITQDNHDEVLARFGGMSGVSVERGDQKLVAQAMAESEAGIFFLRPYSSKIASAPTRLAEFMASGLPIVTGEFIGDMGRYFPLAGVTITSWEDEKIDKAILEVLQQKMDADSFARRRTVAERDFSLVGGAKRYIKIYKDLISGR
jgi:glycosyltransferase involved in cell wall biosynthesis